jgi:hypothetical protein
MAYLFKKKDQLVFHQVLQQLQPQVSQFLILFQISIILQSSFGVKRGLRETSVLNETFFLIREEPSPVTSVINENVREK